MTSSHRRALFLILPLLFLSVIPRLEADELPSSPGAYPGFDVRYGMAPLPSDLSLMTEKPLIIERSTRIYVDAGTGKTVFESQAEAHAFYDVDFSAAVSVFKTEDDAPSYAPGVLECRVVSSEDHHLLFYQLIGAEVLGLRVSYSTMSEAFRDDFPDGAVAYRARLVDSLDGKLHESYTSWYLVPYVVKGKPMTYLHFYMRSGAYNPFPGEDKIVKAFQPKQINDIFLSNLREAKRRAEKTR